MNDEEELLFFKHWPVEDTTVVVTEVVLASEEVV